MEGSVKAPSKGDTLRCTSMHALIHGATSSSCAVACTTTDCCSYVLVVGMNGACMREFQASVMHQASANSSPPKQVRMCSHTCISTCTDARVQHSGSKLYTCGGGRYACPACKEQTTGCVLGCKVQVQGRLFSHTTRPVPCTHSNCNPSLRFPLT